MGKVIQQTDTAPPESMPAQEHLEQRGTKWYFRMPLPRELKRAGVAFELDGRKQRHEIKFSLKTSDHKAAASAVAFHTAIWRAKFDAKLVELQEARLSRQARELLIATGCKLPSEQQAMNKVGVEHVLSDEFVRRIILRHFITLQKDSARRLEDFRNRPELLREEVAHDIALENALTSDHEEADSRLRAELVSHLAEYGIEGLPPSGTTFMDLLRGYRAAKIEDAQRTLSELMDGSARELDPMFKGFNALTPLPDATGELTLGDLIGEFDKFQAKKKVSYKTHRTNAPVFLALKEYFGEKCPVSKLTAQTVTAFFDFMDTVPAHSAKRYKGKLLREAAALEAARSEPRLLEHRTKANYHARVVAMFEYGRNMGTVAFNPANIPPLLSRFFVEKKSDRVPFTQDELSVIFRAPLFLGCKDDERGWFKQGTQVVRRGRFWVPLLALFQGFRCNECCQIEIADVLEKDGVPSISITDTLDDEADAKGKSVKNSSSRSIVPIHPAILRMGFLDFVKKRRVAGDDSRLFPELPRTKEGSYADIFSKWFNRFLDKTFNGKKPEGTFHSFRHAFRDATRRAKMHMEIADRLGRWAPSGGVGSRYGAGFTMTELLEELKKVEYPGVDYSHLLVYTESSCPIRRRA